MTWVLLGLAAWFVIALPVGIAAGRWLERNGHRYPTPEEEA